eukprot:4336774-Pleurochrysis_carterae.AAC.1
MSSAGESSRAPLVRGRYETEHFFAPREACTTIGDFAARIAPAEFLVGLVCTLLALACSLALHLTTNNLLRENTRCSAQRGLYSIICRLVGANCFTSLASMLVFCRMPFTCCLRLILSAISSFALSLGAAWASARHKRFVGSIFKLRASGHVELCTQNPVATFVHAKRLLTCGLGSRLSLPSNPGQRTSLPLPRLRILAWSCEVPLTTKTTSCSILGRLPARSRLHAQTRPRICNLQRGGRGSA